jgi:hypothetical protein
VRGSERDAEQRWGLPGDPENWPVVRLPLIDPWHERPGIWSEETPEWVRILGAIAHETTDPFRLRPTPSSGPPIDPSSPRISPVPWPRPGLIPPSEAAPS